MSDAPETPDVEGALEVLDGLRPWCPPDDEGVGDCLYKRQRNPASELCEVCEAFVQVRDTLRALAAERDTLRARVEELEKAMLGVEHMVDIAHHPSDWAEYSDELKAVIAAFHDALAHLNGDET